MTLGDLEQLKQAAPVEKMPQRSTRVKSAPKATSGVRSSTLADDMRRAAKLREVRSPHKYVGRLHQVGKRVARLQTRRPVQNVSAHFMPV
jgi:hypothetical protein